MTKAIKVISICFFPWIVLVCLFIIVFLLCRQNSWIWVRKKGSDQWNRYHFQILLYISLVMRHAYLLHKEGEVKFCCEKEYLGIALTLMNTSELCQKHCLKSKPFLYTQVHFWNSMEKQTHIWKNILTSENKSWQPVSKILFKKIFWYLKIKVDSQ